MKNRLLYRFIVVVFIILSADSLLADIPKTLEIAFKNMEADTIFSYAFYKRTVQEDKTILESYDPSLPKGKRWKLISVKGKEFNREKIEEQLDKKNEVEKSNENTEGTQISMEDMKNFKLINESNGVLTYSFKLNSEQNDKMAKFVDGEILVEKNQNRIKEIKMYNQSPFSPALSVKIDTFNVDMKFEEIHDTGTNKIKSVNTKVKGKALIFKNIDQEVKEEYFNYNLVE